MKKKTFYEKIDVKEELPEFDETVLWFTESGVRFSGDIDHDNTWENFQKIYSIPELPPDPITHWLRETEGYVLSEGDLVEIREKDIREAFQAGCDYMIDVRECRTEKYIVDLEKFLTSKGIKTGSEK